MLRFHKPAADPMQTKLRSACRWMLTLRQRAHHHAIVCLGADDTAHALRALAHSIERQVVALLDLERLPQVLQPRPVPNPTSSVRST